MFRMRTGARCILAVTSLAILVGCAKRYEPPPSQNLANDYLRNMTATAAPTVVAAPPPPAAPAVNYGAKSLGMKSGMSESDVTTLMGTPVKADLRTCGSKTAAPWQCKIWTYGNYTAGMTVTFGLVDGAWLVNDWSVM
jgi:hypothetical protein